MSLTRANVRSLVIFFGPILLPKAYAYYQNLKKARAQAALPIRPVTRPALRTIFFLSFLAFLLVVKATPLFAPENIFALTQSRLQIPVDSGYWAHEVRIMGEVMEEREVVEGVNDAIGSGRVDIERIERDAEEYARSVLQAEEEAPVTMVG
ncbi:Dolichyl pyrophosphate Glc1Man9GlcNAc2 alpha-1,3-glucosyltransferase [Verticillium dahliae VDG1]|nr:Dolichyl pyrophosphate Glc1Man9GlcNAc2 alpha-1,3-glucosyltransferase [Verticillium dahliae VDG1]